jgi:hypothetical protein
MSTAHETIQDREVRGKMNNDTIIGQEQATSRETRLLKTGKAGIRKYAKAFQAIHETLAVAVLDFREQTAIAYKQCRTIVQTLQDLRKQTNACLTFFQSGKASAFSRRNVSHSVTNSLYWLDGEQTARLILEGDLFGSLVLRQGCGESLSQAEQRIERHVTLQDRLSKETRDLRELISSLERLLAPETAPIPCFKGDDRDA